MKGGENYFTELGLEHGSNFKNIDALTNGFY